MKNTIYVRWQSWLRVGVALVALGGGLLVCRGADETNGTRWRVAMMDFTSDDGLMRSAAEAAQWSVLVQDAVAQQEPAVDWIERSQLHLAADELHLSAGGLTKADASLRVGKWLKADVAIVGRFTRNAQDGDGHTLRLDVVDLNRADTLATRTIHLDGDRRAAIAPDPALIPSTTAVLRAALSDARAQLTRAAHQKVVAPLFFHNADPSPRLDHVESDLMDALAETAGHATDVRLLRFPSAEEARGEAELAILGLSESDPEAWQRVADLYVWGSFHELPAAEVAFAQTPVEVEWSLWDGVNPVRQLKETTTVAQLPATARRLADQCLDAARRVPAVRPATAAVRGEIARSLVAQGERLETTLASHGVMQRAAFIKTPEGQRLARQQHLLFESACFFAPSGREAEFGRLRARWIGFPGPPQQRLPLLDLWQRSNDLADYAARFESASPTLACANVDADAFMLYWLHYGENQIHVSGSEPNLPIDATNADIASWHTALDARFARDTLAYAKVAATPAASTPDQATSYSYAVWMACALQLTHDLAAAARIVEIVWPRYQAFYRQHTSQEDQRYGIDSGLVPAMHQLYAGLHQPARADAILGVLSPMVPAPSATPAVVTANVPVATLSPRLPTLTPVTRSLHFPEGTTTPNKAMPWLTYAEEYVVQCLAVGSDDVLWISAFRGEDNLSKPLDAQKQELWRFDPADDSLRALPLEGLSRQTPITSLLPHAGDLWLTIGLTGVWQYDPDKAQVARRYTVADGLLTLNMDSSVRTAAGQLYFAGHENGVPLLNRFDAAGRNWLRIGLPASANHTMPASAAMEPPPLTQVCTFGRWLLVRMGESWTLVDTQSHQTQSLREALPPALREKIASFAETSLYPGMAPDRLPLPRTLPCVADARGFWLAVDGKIIQFDPAHPQTAKSWPLPGELADGVTALAADGEDLWMAGPAGSRLPASADGANNFALSRRLGHDGKGFVAVLHEADGQWRGSFGLPAPVGCIAASRQTVYVDQQMLTQPILEIDKDATLAPRALTSFATKTPSPP